MKKVTKRTTIWMDEDTRALVDKLAEEEDRTLSKVIKIALHHFAKSRDDAAEMERKVA